MERPGELQEAVGHERLSSNVSGILARLEGELDHVDSKIGESMHVLDLDNDGLVPSTPPFFPIAPALRPSSLSLHSCAPSAPVSAGAHSAHNCQQGAYCQVCLLADGG